MCLGVGVCGGGWIVGGSGGFLVGCGECGGGGNCGGCGVRMVDGACVAGCDAFRVVVCLILLGMDEARGEGDVGGVFGLFCRFCVVVVRGGVVWVCLDGGACVSSCRLFLFAARLFSLGCGIWGGGSSGGDGLGVFRLSCLFRLSLDFCGCEICDSVAW
jgi:hypothetical protein